METVENSYCRFCAELRSSDKLLNLLNDCKIQDEVMAKLTFLNAMYVDVSNRNILPKTVCFVCFDSLNKAYEFLVSVKRAQDILTTVFSSGEINKCDNSDDESLDDLLSPDLEEESTDIKIESVLDSKPRLSELGLKSELKEEKDPEELPYDDSLNVQELIDVAMGNVALTSSMTIYAKDVTDMSKKEISNWTEYPWMCSYCSIEFMSMDMVRSHAKIVHGKCSAHFCVDCKIGFKDDFSAFVKHVRKHRKYLRADRLPQAAPIHELDTCAISSEEDDPPHDALTPDKKKPFSECECSRNYCYYCNEQVEGLSELKLHLKQHHQKPQTACPLCGEIHKSEESLTMHLHQYGSVKPKRRPRRKPGTPITVAELTCDLCKKVYKNPNSLRDHMKLHTINRKRDYTCDRCGKMFYNKGTLTSHIMSHDKIRPHLCRICNRSFLFPNMLRRHVEMHTGVKPFSCEQCGRFFRLQYQLNAHKIVHTDSMPYVCQYCNKAFRFKQILKNHERQHTGAKPYSCQNCGMEFTNWSNYNKHMKRRHNTDTSKKKITPNGVFPINPETGLIVRVDDSKDTEEWKTKIMVPGKRGKKKVIKQENVV